MMSEVAYAYSSQLLAARDVCSKFTHLMSASQRIDENGLVFQNRISTIPSRILVPSLPRWGPSIPV
ncbi:MAG: hypothetical protein ACKPKO_08175, partial [Candidatus Fonsibacter sp.]